jgi:tryptophanyl-tRNA synthetase
MIEEIEKMKKGIMETKGLLAEAYIEFIHKVKAKSNRLQKERTEMEQMFRDFNNKH